MVTQNKLKKLVLGLSLIAASSAAMATTDTAKPNILAIWGDDIGPFNISAYNRGIMGYKTPNIDRIANEGIIFTDSYGDQSCTAGRAGFITGQHPMRTGLTKVGLPGAKEGLNKKDPTIAELLKPHGYMTGQFGKNHLGDQDEHLPTNHGFDEFFGNLYHLNAEEEPETYYYPKDPRFKKKFGPRGVLHTFADGRMEDTGALTRKRMETADEEFLGATLKFIDKAHKADKPFFIWYNSTRMHVHTRLQEKWQGKSGISIYADGMLEHDEHVGVLLDKLDDLKIADNTIVIYTTDNGAETFTWPDGGNTPFHGEKGTTYEGGMRVPQLVRWPGTIKPGSKMNSMMSHLDWMPTLAAAMGNDTLVADLKEGGEINNKKWRVHLDGFNFKPYFAGEVDKGPRETIMYFSQSGQLNAIRWNDWKASFALVKGDMASGTREVPAWPQLVNLRADPFEKGPIESSMYVRWMVDNMWAFVPVSGKVKEFLGSLEGYPMQVGQSFGAADINYTTLQMKAFVKKVSTEIKAK